MEPINTQMEIDTKEIGTMTFKMALGPITTQMGTFTRENG